MVTGIGFHKLASFVEEKSSREDFYSFFCNCFGLKSQGKNFFQCFQPGLPKSIKKLPRIQQINFYACNWWGKLTSCQEKILKQF